MSFTLAEISTGGKPIEVLIANDSPSFLDRITEIGTRWVVGQESPHGERVKIINGVMTIGEATGLNHRVGKNDIEVYDSFDYLASFRFKEVEVLMGRAVRFFKESYQRTFIREDEDGIVRIYKMQCYTKLKGYKLPEVFIDDNGQEVDYIDVMKYPGIIENGKFISKEGIFPTNQSQQNLLNATRNIDGLGALSRYTLRDEKLFDYLSHRWSIRLGTLNSQSVLMGAVNLPTGNTRLSIGNQLESNSVVISKTNASSFRVGMTIIGATTDWGNPNVFKRIITNIQEDYPNVGETTITFDGEVVDVPEGTIIAAHPWKTGSTKNVVASDGYLNANDGLYPCKMEGIENPWGNQLEGIAGVKILGDEVWVADKMSFYNFNANTENYHKLEFNIPRTNGYIKSFGVDSRFPWAKYPLEVGGSTSTFYADIFWQNYSEGGYRVVLRGGYLSSGLGAGPFACSVSAGLTAADFDIVGRAFYKP